MEREGLRIIGTIRSCFPENFGIPRQSGLVPAAVAELHFARDFARRELIRGVEQFSHLWLVFLFHQAIAEGWQPTVRPPRLGGRRRLGIFATRSPHRPNHLGLSLVRLLGVMEEGDKLVLTLGGVDLLDNTPVLDIKPYLPYADQVAGARCGVFRHDETTIAVTFSLAARDFCRQYEAHTGRSLTALIEGVLASDPRPASQRGKKKHFGVSLWDVNVRWRAEGDHFHVHECSLHHTGTSISQGDSSPSMTQKTRPPTR